MLRRILQALDAWTDSPVGVIIVFTVVLYSLGALVKLLGGGL